MKSRCFLLITALLFACSLKSQSIFYLKYPLLSDPYAGSELHQLLHQELSSLDNQWIPNKIFKEDHWMGRIGNMTFRLLKMGTYEFYLTYLPVLNQHEYFGHVVRAKQLHSAYTRYEIDLFPPTGGRAYYGNFKYEPLTHGEMTSLLIGGMEANSIMAESIRLKSLLRGYSQFQQYMLFLGSKTDLATYVLFSKTGGSNDIENYLKEVNVGFGMDDRITRKQLIIPSVLSTVLDPFILRSVYGIISGYLVKGEFSLPTRALVRGGKLGWIPGYSFELGLVGPRHYFTNYLIMGRSAMKLAIYSTFYPKSRLDRGIQYLLSGFPLGTRSFFLDVDLRVWQSMSYQYHNNDGALATTDPIGGLFSVSLYKGIPLKPFGGRRWLAMVGFVMKTNGYTPGYSIQSQTSLLAGLGYSIPSGESQK